MNKNFLNNFSAFFTKNSEKLQKIKFVKITKNRSEI